VSALRAVVVVPARDEAERIAACLEALGAQEGVDANEFAVIVVLDRCRDRTGAVARAAGTRIVPAVEVVASPRPGVGPARRHGMQLACERLGQDGLIACTDADTRPTRRWLAEQLALAAAGAQAVGGLVELDPAEAAALDPATIARRDQRAAERLAAVRRAEPASEHPHFAGASLAVTVAAYRRAGGLEPRPVLEDEAFAARLSQAGIAIARSRRVRVHTSARAESRAGRGLGRDLELGEWLARRRFDGADYDAGLLLERKGERAVSVILPAKNCAATIGAVLDTAVMPYAEAGLIDEVLVVDADSPDGTAGSAAAAGAEVVSENALALGCGPSLGKGDAMWRGLAATHGDVLVFLDADTANPHPAHLLGVLGPLLCVRELQLVKGAFARPLLLGGDAVADEGGRVTELMARPLLNLHVPELAGFSQPLAGEFAARRTLLEALPFPAGYGVEIALLIDALRHAGLDALAEAQIPPRHNRHQPLRDLGAMAFAVLAAVEQRVRSADAAVPAGLVQPWADHAVRDVVLLERPPLAQLSRNGGSSMRA
jgi:glycosyltransferase involved in cell wall biosynthesis